jgi:hypothetical protein
MMPGHEREQPLKSQQAFLQRWETLQIAKRCRKQNLQGNEVLARSEHAR